jgi:hypothetical protein
MCHARARNIIERAFGRLKGRWVILRSPSYFPIKTQCRIIMACALLHNLILQKMSRYPMESEEHSVVDSEMPEGEVGEPEFIMGISTTNVWSTFRDTCRRFETGGSLSRRVSVPRAPAQMGRARGRARRRESEVAGDGRERGGNPAAFVFVPRPGRVRLQ